MVGREEDEGREPQADSRTPTPILRPALRPSPIDPTPLCRMAVSTGPSGHRFYENNREKRATSSETCPLIRPAIRRSETLHLKDLWRTMTQCQTAQLQEISANFTTSSSLLSELPQSLSSSLENHRKCRKNDSSRLQPLCKLDTSSF